MLVVKHALAAIKKEKMKNRASTGAELEYLKKGTRRTVILAPDEMGLGEASLSNLGFAILHRPRMRKIRESLLQSAAGEIKIAQMAGLGQSYKSLSRLQDGWERKMRLARVICSVIHRRIFRNGKTA